MTELSENISTFNVSTSSFNGSYNTITLGSSGIKTNGKTTASQEGPEFICGSRSSRGKGQRITVPLVSVHLLDRGS